MGERKREREREREKEEREREEKRRDLYPELSILISWENTLQLLRSSMDSA